MQTLPVDAGATASQPRTQRGMNALNSEDFFKILVTELRHQDPFEPTDTGTMIGQVSQIRSIELSKQLTDALSHMTNQQHTAGASELLGKFVTATVRAEDGTEQKVSGVVTGVRFDPDGGAVLELDTGEAVLAADVTHITSVELAGRQPSSGDQAAADDRSTDDPAPAEKMEQNAKERSGGLLPWLSLDGVFHL